MPESIIYSIHLKDNSGCFVSVGRVWEQLITRPCPKLKPGMGTGYRMAVNDLCRAAIHKSLLCSPAPRPGQFHDLRNTFLFVLPSYLLSLGISLFSSLAMKNKTWGLNAARRGMGMNSDLHLCSCSAVHSQAAPIV